jgi:hypothetical protein
MKATMEAASKGASRRHVSSARADPLDRRVDDDGVGDVRVVEGAICDRCRGSNGLNEQVGSSCCVVACEREPIKDEEVGVLNEQSPALTSDSSRGIGFTRSIVRKAGGHDVERATVEMHCASSSSSSSGGIVRKAAGQDRDEAALDHHCASSSYRCTRNIVLKPAGVNSD